MLYTYLRGLVVFLLRIINGNAHHHDEDKILGKDENYILVAPHHTWWGPACMAFVARPKEFIFMAKKGLFTNRISGWWIRMRGAFPIDRENPEQKVPKYPVNMLKKSNRSFMMSLSGGCHSTDVKGGIAVIVKIAEAKTMSIVYTGPMELKGFLTGERVDMNFDSPVDISGIKHMNDEGIEEVADRIQAESDRLDAENATCRTNKKSNLLTYIYRIPLGLVVIIVVLSTLLPSYIASLV